MYLATYTELKIAHSKCVRFYTNKASIIIKLHKIQQQDLVKALVHIDRGISSVIQLDIMLS